MISEQIGLDLLRLYVAVCRQGSLNRVAVQTGRTQSALSMQVRRLETLLGKRLFQRTGRGVVPTADGEVFLGYATRILALGDEAQARLQQAVPGGSLRIGLAEEMSTSALPAALGRLHRAYPDTHLDVVVEHSVALGRLWDEAGLDIMVAPTSTVAADAVMTWTVGLIWAAAKDYVVDEERPLDLIAFGLTCPWRRRIIEALSIAGREHRVVVTSQSVTALQAAIENGLGVGLLPPEALRAQTMRMLTTGLPRPLTVQYGLYAPDRRTPAIAAAVDVLLEDLPR